MEFIHSDGTHNTSFALGETIYIYITTTLNDNPGELKLKVYDYLGNKFQDIADFFTKQPGGPPYKYSGNIDASVANGFSNDHFLFEVRLKDNTNIITFDTIEIGGGSDPPKYIRTFSDPDYSDPTPMFTRDQLVYVEVYTGGSLPTTGNSKIHLADYRENKDEQTDDSYTLVGNCSRFSYDLSATTINLVEGDWYTVVAFDLRNSGGTHLIENWHAQIQIVPVDIINITWAGISNDTGQPQQDFHSGDKVVINATANHSNHASRILGMNMTVVGPEGVLIDNRSMDHVKVDPANPPLWKNYSTTFDLLVVPRGDYEVHLTVLGKNDQENNSELQFTVHNYVPITEDLHIGQAITLRNNSIPIYFNGSDFEDGESNLTSHLEYNDTYGTGWNTTYLSQPFYDIDVWRANLNLPMDAPLGCNDLRVRFNDSDGNYSQWLELEDAICVVNEGPMIIDINSTAQEVLRTNTISIYVNANDIETSEEDLDLNLQYRSPTSIWTNISVQYEPSGSHWITDLVPDMTADLGDYSFRAKARDGDDNTSLWFDAPDLFEVKNNLPLISQDLDEITVDAWFIDIELGPYGSDVEDDVANLTWEIDQTSVNEELITVKLSAPGYVLSIEPVGAVEGEDEITLNLTDKDGGTVNRTDIKVIVDMRIPEDAPKVFLLSPANGGKVGTVRPDLRWSVDFSGPELILYDIYLDDEEDLRTLIAKDLSTTLFSVQTPLADGKSYNWTVIPHADTKLGICSSGIWSFTVDLNFTHDFGVNVTTDKDRIILSQGQSGEVNLNVRNTGNTADVISIEVDRGGFSGTVISSDPYPWLDMGASKVIPHTINVPDSTMPGDYIIIVKGTSQGGGATVSDNVLFTISVIEKGTTPRYGVNMTLDRVTIKIEQGKSMLVRLTVCNDGNVGGTFNLTYTSTDDGSLDVQIGVGSLGLDGGDCEDVTITIIIPESMEPGTYSLTFKAASDKVDGSQNLSLTVKERKTQPPVFDPFSNVMSCLLPIIIGIILLIIIIAVLSKRRTERLPEGLADEEQGAEGAVPYAMVPEETDITEENFDITEIFIIYKGGRLINHTALMGDKNIDKELVGGMLFAIQSFIQESFDTKEGMLLDSFALGDKKIIIAAGNYLQLAVVLEGTEPSILQEDMKELAQKIEGLYAGVVEKWDGSLEQFEDIEKYLLPIVELKSKLKIKAKKKLVRMKSAMEFIRGYVRLKVAVQNDLDDPIKEITMTLDHDVNSLRMSHIEPEYPISGSNIFLTDIYGNEKRTVAVYFDPVICQESHIDGWVNFMDPDGTVHEVRMKRKPVDIVCPIFYTTETVNVAMLKRLYDDLQYKDSRMYPLRKVKMLKDLYKYGKEVIRGYNVKFVREYSEKDPFIAEIWFYGEVKKTEEKIVIMASANEGKQYMEIFVATSNLATMTGLLAELGGAFEKKIKKTDMFKELMLSKLDQINLELVRGRTLLDKQAESEVEDDEKEDDIQI